MAKTFTHVINTPEQKFGVALKQVYSEMGLQIPFHIDPTAGDPLEPPPLVSEFKKAGRSVSLLTGAKLGHVYERMAKAYGFQTYSSFLHYMDTTQGRGE